MSTIKPAQSKKPSRHPSMSYVNSYTNEQDEHLRENYKHQTHKQMADAIGRTPDSVKARLKQLNLYKLKPQYINKKGVLRKGYKYILYSDWETKLDTPCPLLRLCSRCEELRPAIDFYKLNQKGGEDITGTKRSRFCPECSMKNYVDLDSRKKIIYRARQRAKRDGRPCTLKPEDIIIHEYCPVLGIRLIEKKGAGRPTGESTNDSPSIDRINNDEGYTPDNICIISNKANKLKRDGKIAEVIPLLAFLMDAEMNSFTLGDSFVPYATRGEKEIIDILNKFRDFAKSVPSNKEEGGQ